MRWKYLYLLLHCKMSLMSKTRSGLDLVNKYLPQFQNEAYMIYVYHFQSGWLVEASSASALFDEWSLVGCTYDAFSTETKI